MPTTNDLWFIRFPDGRVLRADGAGTVRQQLAAGRFPPGTRLRRSLEDKWRSAERYPEFADVASAKREKNGKEVPTPNGRPAPPQATPGTIASHLDPRQLGQVGVRAFFEEMLAALDSTAVGGKLLVAALAGMVLSALAVLARLPLFQPSLEEVGWGWLLVAGAVVVLAGLAAVLSRMTYAELSRLRPSRLRDGIPGVGKLTIRLTVAFTLLGGMILAMVLLLRWLPGKFLLLGEGREDQVWLLAAEVVATLAVPGEALLWALLLMLMPLAALLAVEECSVVSGLWQWLKLVRKYPLRVLVAQSMIFSFAWLLTIPLGAVLAALWTWEPPSSLARTVDLARAVFAGLALSVPVAYVLVANVFSYLHLRYEAARR